MKIVVGLGNPGRRYAGTRHNLGFDVVDYLAQSPSCGAFRERFDALAAESTEADQQLVLVKPQSFMNLSGLAVRRFVDFYQLPLPDLLIVCDDFNLPLGSSEFAAAALTGDTMGSATSRPISERPIIHACASRWSRRQPDARSSTFSAVFNRASVPPWMT